MIILTIFHIVTYSDCKMYGLTFLITIKTFSVKMRNCDGHIEKKVKD